jgi:NAD(P)-dependent dehydrogenase (short-subunit alcohol dehydrogenase family)
LEVSAISPWTQDDIPDQSGRTVVVTGASSGLGLEAALALARKGGRVIGTSRSEERGRAALSQIRDALPGATVEFEQLDVADLASVRAFAGRVLAEAGPIDVLLNNAGVMAVPERRTTVDGFELHFGTNHLGPFALTGLLLPALLARPGARVVMVTSNIYTRGKIAFDDLQAKKKYRIWDAYGQSKLANVLFTHELNRRARDRNLDLVSVAAHPGIAKTNLQYAGPALGKRSVASAMSRLLRRFGQPAEQGALPLLHAATAPDIEGGTLYGPDGRGQVRGYPKQVSMAARALDDDVASRLWAVSEELTGVTFEFGPPPPDR